MARELTFMDVVFTWAALIDPERDAAGAPIEFIPQDRYAKAATTRLNPNGAGPFCRFAVKGLPHTPGVYAVTVDESLVYMGKAQDLDERWGPRGYAAIHSRNCYVGGQSTNCKVNHLILRSAQERRSVELWIHTTDNPGTLEGGLIRTLSPPWNARRP